MVTITSRSPAEKETGDEAERPLVSAVFQEILPSESAPANAAPLVKIYGPIMLSNGLRKKRGFHRFWKQSIGRIPRQEKGRPKARSVPGYKWVREVAPE